MLEARGLTVTYRKGIGRRLLTALDGLDLVVPRGDFFALLGQNGAGKSTAMACFLGLLRPTSGTVLLDGETPRPGALVFARIGYLPEEPVYHLYLTIGEALDYYASLHGIRLTPARRKELLDRFGIAEFERMRLSKCSKGMKQKLGIAQCLVNDPEILFLDEPMRGLDPVAVRTFRDLLKEMHAKGATIVMSSHIMTEVQQVATRAAVLDRGRLVALERVDVLASRMGTLENAYLSLVGRAPHPAPEAELEAPDA